MTRCCLFSVTGRRFLYGKQIMAVAALTFYLLAFTTFLAPFKIGITLPPMTTTTLVDNDQSRYVCCCIILVVGL
jgi:hypothetical protein